MPEEPLWQENLPKAWRASTPVKEGPLMPEDLPRGHGSMSQNIPNGQAGSAHATGTSGDREPGGPAEEEVAVISFSNEGILLFYLFYPYQYCNESTP